VLKIILRGQATAILLLSALSSILIGCFEMGISNPAAKQKSTGSVVAGSKADHSYTETPGSASKGTYQKRVLSSTIALPQITNSTSIRTKGSVHLVSGASARDHAAHKTSLLGEALSLVDLADLAES
jgi:hypothetical protein